MLRILCSDGAARVAELRAGEKSIVTPEFVPVATSGFVKAFPPSALRAIGVRALITNSIHHLIYGTVESLGGLIGGVNGIKMLFTDSGGFQIVRKDFTIEAVEGGLSIEFGGKKILVTPQISLRIQESLGSDVIFQPDFCPPYGVPYGVAALAVERTLEYARGFFGGSSRALRFAIVQGGIFKDLRYRHAEALRELNPDGYGIGGLAVGEPMRITHRVARATVQALPWDAPKHFLGLGTPRDILEAVSYGVDTFDSAFPTRNARHGSVLSAAGYVDIAKVRRGLEDPVNPALGDIGHIPVGALRTIYTKDPMSAYPLLTEINLRSMILLMEITRSSICKGEFWDLLGESRKDFSRVWDYYR